MFVRELNADPDGVWWRLPEETRVTISKWLVDQDVDPAVVRSMKLMFDDTIELELFVRDDTGAYQVTKKVDDDDFEVVTETKTVPVKNLPKAWPLSRDWQ